MSIERSFLRSRNRLEKVFGKWNGAGYGDRKGKGKRKIPPRHNKILFEPLEPRLLLDAIVAHWIGDSGNWSDPTHWDIGYAPNNADNDTYTAIIDVAGTPTVTIDQNVTINSLTNAETVLVQTGTATIAQQTTNSGSIQVADAAAQLKFSGTINDTGEISATTGALDFSNGTLTVDGSGAQVTGSGTVGLSQVSMFAMNGGVISLPGAATYADGSAANHTIQATGAGSRIDLSHLSTMAGAGYSVFALSINAVAGGEVDLGGEIGGRTLITLSDAGSVLNVAGVTGLTDTTVTVSAGNTANFSSLTTLARTSLSASAGGRILFPAVTSYADGSAANHTIQATGAGSRIDLSHLSTMAGAGYSVYALSINAVAGGEVDLGGEIGGRTLITLSDAGSVLNVAGVTGLTDTTVTVSAGNTANFSSLSTLARTSLSASAGGRILFPAVTSYADGSAANHTIQASGVGSRIDLSHLGTMAGAGYSAFALSINAVAGGEVDLGGAIAGYTAITLSDAGSVLNLAGVKGLAGTTLTAANGAIWVFPSGWTPIWGTACTFSTSGSGSQFINQGNISLTGVTLAVNTSAFINQGVLNALASGVFDINGSFRVDGLGILSGVTGGAFTISGDLLGNTRNADQYAPQAVVRFDGAGTPAAPQQLEVMGRDVGEDPTGLTKNFVYGTISLANNTYLKLVDLSDNATGTDPEAVYTNSLIVPAGTTLDLNGLHLYARTAQVSGTIVGGTVSQIPDSGPIILATATPGSISVPGELDEWTFFGRAGRSVTVVVNPGSGGSPAPLAPYLGYAQVQLLDAADNVMATSAGSSNGEIVSLSGVALPADGTYRVQIRASEDHSANTGNYLVTLWDVTADVNPLVLNQQRTGSIETPYSVDRWTFSAVAGQQVQFDLVNMSGTGIVFDLTGPGGWTGFSDIAGDSDLITLPALGNYALTAHGTGGQYGGTYAFSLKETAVADLNLGDVYTGEFAGSCQAQLFRINVPQSGQLLIKLDDSAGNNVNELYASFGAPPTRGDYDLRGTVAASADQTLFAPLAYSGTWYVLVYGNTIRTPGPYTLTATTAEVSITSITPDRGAATADVQITVNGGGYVNGTTVELVSSGGTAYSATDVIVDSFERMTATFAAGSVPADTVNPYSLRVTSPGAVEVTLDDCFTMKPSGEAHFETHLVVPSSVGRHTVATLYVEYANTGDVAMAAPLLVLGSGDPDDSDHPLLTLDQSRLSGGFWTSAIPEGFSESIQFLASGSQPGILQPGESGRIPVYYAGLLAPWDFSDSSVEFVVGVLDPNNTIPVDWSSLKDTMRPDYVQPDAWDAIWANFTAATGYDMGQLPCHA
jgi:hypothetical protein